jgi:hypothetical protein
MEDRRGSEDVSLGLDLIVEAAAKPGHEAEWRRFIERAFADGDLSDADVARFEEISIPPYARVGAPRVGYDEAANAWILEVRKAATPEEQAAVLREFHGHYALPLVKSDGLPGYTHANLYQDVDETSFRGSFLSLCPDVLPHDVIVDAWNPEAAVDYGRVLLAAAKGATPPSPSAPPKRGLLARLGLGKPAEPAEPFEDQVKIVEAAGRWFIFWGERGHAIRAWS